MSLLLTPPSIGRATAYPGPGPSAFSGGFTDGASICYGKGVFRVSAALFLLTLVISIAILVVLIMKVKLHPTFALFLVGLGMALVNGFPFMEAMSLLTKGFGNTLGSLGVPIMLGAILWIATLAVSIVYVMKYAAKVKKDRGSTILSLQEQQDEKESFGKDEIEGEVVLTGRQKGALIVFALAFIIMVISFIPWEDFGVTLFLGWSEVITGLPLGQWYFVEAACWFFVLALIIAFVGGLSESETVKAFIDGCADMMSVVMIIALARGISILMAETGMSDWILLNASNALQGVSAFIFAPASWLLYVVLSFLIPSSSGMATVSMPIMGPLATSVSPSRPWL